MALRRHSTRLSRANGTDAAPGTGFRAGQAVMTSDGLPGKVTAVSDGPFPGSAEYEVTLDGGMGHGTYAPGQLRATGSTTGEVHLASDDYPEMGSVLTERPDPGSVITVIGRRLHAGYLDDEPEHRGPDNSWSDTEVSMPWHDSPAMDPPGRDIHRGIALHLPEHVHAVVHDESRPAHERGFALARHLLSTPHPDANRGQGLGYNWTDDPEVAKARAEQDSGIGSTATPVVLHARMPEREHLEDDKNLLRERYRTGPDPDSHDWGFEHDPWSFPDASTREVSMKSGSSVPLTGVSWGPVGYHYTRDTSMGGYADARHDPRYNHLDFPEGLSARASATYGRPEDARDGEYNGGPNDTGMYWAEPGQQEWSEEHVGPQQEAPPPLWAVPPVMARLAQIEEACQFFGGTFHHATTINGTQVDDHGDAPEHGLVPRATDPNSYDRRSTEGNGDPKWDDPASKVATDEYNGATVGMYPEGMSAGGGPGLEIGAFTAAAVQGAARVPWTSGERARLHSWDAAPGGTAGDFVSSDAFPGRHDLDVPAGEAAREELRATEAAYQPGTPGTPGTGPAGTSPVRPPGRHEHVTNFLTSLVDLLGHGHDDDENSLDYGNDPALSGNVPPDNSAGQPDNSANPQASAMGLSGNDPGSSGNVQDWPMASAAVTETGPAWTQGRNDGKRGRALPAPAALGMMTASASSPAFRFEFTAAWHDVVAKARRIRAEGHVRITHASVGMVIGEVRGDHDTYESGIQRPPGKPQTIQHWACGCPWASFHQDKSLGARYSGRPCSHVMALQYEAQARGMFGKSVAPDEQAPAWSKGDVTVKSWPPYEGDPHKGHWQEYWLAPTGSLRHATPDEARDWDWPPEARDEWDRAHGSTVECLYPHHGPCPTAREMAYLAGHLYHVRPSALITDITPNPTFNPASQNGADSSTHLMTGYLGGRVAGMLHFSKSDDGQAYHVGMLHTYPRPGERPQGVGSSMMDDLYHEVKQNGRWLDHGWRTDQGNKWWGRYQEPHPEVNIHHAHPDQGWKDYFSPHVVAADAAENYSNSGGRGAHTRLNWRAASYPHDEQEGKWTRYLGTAPASQQAIASLLRAGEDPADIIALAELGGCGGLARRTAEVAASSAMMRRHLEVAHGLAPEVVASRDGGLDELSGFHDRMHEARAAVALPHSHGAQGGEGGPQGLAGEASLTFTADQANGPWGAQNVSDHPPGKPYGATQPLNHEQDPGSYGPLAAPDPENWGSIQEGSYLQSPLSNQAAHKVLVPGDPQPVPPHLNYPDMSGWHENQESFGYSDRAGTAGPSTAITPRDPQGIRMEEARRDCPCCGGSGEHDTGRECYGCDASGSSDGYSGGVPCEGAMPYGTDDHGHQVELHPMDGWQHLDGSVSHDDGTSVTDGPVTAELRDEPEAALPSTTGDDLEATAAADGTIGGGDAGDGTDDQSPAAVVGLGEFGAVQNRPDPYQAVRDRFRASAGTAMGDQARSYFPQAQQPSAATQEPGMGSMDEELSPDDPSIQTVGNQQWSGGGADSDEVDVPAGEPQGSLDDIVASFQRSAAARAYGDRSGGQAASNSDIAGAARDFLSKTADVLPDAEAAELISEGRGQRARNLSLLRLEGTHYEDEDDSLARRGLSLDDYDDDVISF